MEFEFRGKSEYGKWIEGDLICYKNGYYSINTGFSAYGYEASEIINRTKVDAKTIGQYIGLKDINYKKIYSGDIVRFFDLGVTKQIGYVDFRNGSFMIDTGLTTWYCWTDYDVEVIGNIHDNKNLLDFDVEEDK